MTDTHPTPDPEPGQSADVPPTGHQTGDPAGELIAAARAQVDVILRVRDIATVIYVDDGNPAQGQAEGDPERVIVALESGQLTIDALASSDATAHLTRDETGELTTSEILADRLRVYIDDFSDEDIAALTDAVRLHERSEDPSEDPGQDPGDPGEGPSEGAGEGAIVGGARGEETTEADRRTTDLAALAELRALIPDGDTEFRPITLAAWEQEKAAVLASDEPVLVLFDRDFSREGHRTDAGEQLLTEAISVGNENVYCGMLTHSATSDQAENELVARIAERGGRAMVEIVVISKQTVIDKPASFPAKLKGALLARPLHQLRDTLTTGYLAAAHEAVDDVTSLDAYTLSELVAAADEEGAHGSHNIVRVAATRLRASVQRSMWTDTTISDLLHEIRTVHKAGRPRNPLPRADITALRRADRYLDGKFLAELHLPLEPGDIFEKVDPAVMLRGATQKAPGKRYIVLMQACDIAVRANGHRLGDPLTLTLARLKKVKENKVRSFDHRLEWYDEAGEGEVWCVQLLERVPIPARALEACVFGADGYGIVDPSHQRPPGLTPGWGKRFDDLQTWRAAQIATYQAMTDHQTRPDLKKIITQHLTGTSDQLVDIRADIDPAAGKIAFGLRRVGRASDDDARLILANAGNYTARPARDGNLFLEELDHSEAHQVR